MRIWIIQDGEPIPGLDPGARPWRAGMLAGALTARGHEVVWWAAAFDHFQKKHRAPGSPAISVCEGLTVRLLEGPGYAKNRSFRRLVHQRGVARVFLHEAAGSPAPQVLFAGFPTVELAEASVTYGRAAGRPVILDIRDLWPDHYLTMAPPALRGMARLALELEFRRARRALRGAAGLTAISRRFLQWGLSRAGRPESPADDVFPMGHPGLELDSEEVRARRSRLAAELGLESGTLLLAFVGALNYIFDFESVLRAAEILERRRVRVRFVFAGAGEALAGMEKSVGNRPNVTLLGWQDGITVAALLGLAAAGIAPYRPGSTVDGAMPNKLFEYMAAGLPVISSMPGETETLLRENGIGKFYPAHDPEALAGLIRELEADRDGLSQMGRRAAELYRARYSAPVVYSAFARHLEAFGEVAS